MGTHDLQNIFKGHSCPSKFKNYLQEMASIEMGGFNELSSVKWKKNKIKVTGVYPVEGTEDY